MSGDAQGGHFERDKEPRTCWLKFGWLSGEPYCGTHGRDAGWPCTASETIAAERGDGKHAVPRSVLREP